MDEPHKLKAALFSNIALCHLKLQNYYEARKAVIWNHVYRIIHLVKWFNNKFQFKIFRFFPSKCDTVLEIEPKNVKALYRRGQAKLQSGDASPAMEDFKKVNKSI